MSINNSRFLLCGWRGYKPSISKYVNEQLTVPLRVEVAVVARPAALLAQPAPWRRGPEQDELPAEDAAAGGSGGAPGGQRLVPAGPGRGPGDRSLAALRAVRVARLLLPHLLAAPL